MSWWVGKFARLWVDELVSFWVGEFMSFWVGEFLSWWDCELVSFWVGEFVSLWVGELMSSAVVGFREFISQWVDLLCTPPLFVEILKVKTTSRSSIGTSPLYWHNKAPCTGITRGLYGGYKMLVAALQIVFSRHLYGKMRFTNKNNKPSFHCPYCA